MLNLGERLGESDDLTYKVAFGLLFVGFAVYTLGVCYMAPKQEDKVMSLVKDLMKKGKADFVSQQWWRLSNGHVVNRLHQNFDEADAEAVIVHLALTVYPDQTDGETRRFDQLDESSADDRNTFRLGMVKWGVGAVWDAVEVNNAKNCCERAHGSPFWRTARYGFMAQPSPKDLGGIFNANALYSFAVGTFELIFGALMFFSDGGLSLQTILPLSVSAVSWLLSIANVLFDFAGVLMEIEAEARMADAIQNRIDTAMQTRKANALRMKDQDTARIHRDHARDGVAGMLKKKDQLADVFQQYEEGLQMINDEVLAEMRSELTQWKKKMEEQRRLLRGGRNRILQNLHRGELDRASRDKDVMQKKEQEVIDYCNKKLRKVKATDPKFETKTKEIYEERARKLKALREAYEHMGETNANPSGDKNPGLSSGVAGAPLLEAEEP
jgi:hypothetical protein